MSEASETSGLLGIGGGDKDNLHLEGEKRQVVGKLSSDNGGIMFPIPQVGSL
jgi:hypothetical protein